MSAQALITTVLLIAGLYAALRAPWPGGSSANPAGPAASPRSAPTRLAIALLSLASAALLAVVLFPPKAPRPSGSLLVLAAGSTPTMIARHPRVAQVVALPEAPAFAGVERVPDLATALRRYPASRDLVVAGIGLPVRDHQAAAGRTLRFDAAPLPRGVVELHVPVEVVAGRQWSLQGRLHGLARGHAELLDPAGERVDRVALARDGGFALRARARAPGRVAWSLRLRDDKGEPVETLALPMQVQSGVAQRVWALSGGPDPELKYLRRWAVDAGLSLRTRINLGGGMAIGDVPAISRESLREVDLVLLDERAWRDLGAGQREALRVALGEGLGLLLRITGPLSAQDRRELQALGFSASDTEAASRVRLAPSLLDDEPVASTGDDVAADDIEARASRATDPTLALLRRPLRVRAEDGLPLLRDDRGEPPALWRGEGRGRIGLWWLSDSWRLVLSGRADAHGQLWSDTVAVLARARPAGKARLATDPDGLRVQQRLVACGLSPAASVSDPRGRTQALRIDPASGADACAGYWPSQAGWHELSDGGQRLAFPVRSADEAAALQAQRLQSATRRLVGEGAATASAPPVGPGPRWPWFLAWLAASGLLWWLEQRQRRAGLPG